MSDYTSITIDQVQVHVEVGEHGHISLWTDGYPMASQKNRETFDRIVTTLRGLQTDEEREFDCQARWLPGSR